MGRKVQGAGLLCGAPRIKLGLGGNLGVVMFEPRCVRAGLLFAACLCFASFQALAQDRAASPAAEAPPPIIPTSAFASRTVFSDAPVLSPDGSYVAFSLVEDGKTSVDVLRIDGAVVVQKIVVGKGEDVQWVGWAGNGRVLVAATQSIPVPALGIELRTSRVFSVEIANATVRQVAHTLDDLVHVDPDGAFLLVSRQRPVPGPGTDMDVWRTWTDGSGRPDERVTDLPGVFRWIADETGALRVGLGLDGRKLKVWYRSTGEEAFRVIGKLREGDDEEMWKVVRVIAGTDEGLTLEPGPSGRVALRKFNYATREVGEVIYENPDCDTEDFTVDEEGRPQAVQFTDDRERIVWLDPAMAALQARLERALGEDGQVRIVQRSRNGARVLISSTSASNPGSWYFYTPADRKLQEFAKLRPEVDVAALTKVEPIEYAARDGTTIHGYLTLPRGREAKALPLIVMPHGGPYGIRDSLDYSDEVQLLANRGYAVLQPNYRGSGGYGEAFTELGRGQIGRRMQDDLDDAVDWAAGQGLIDPARVCLVGASYGGYAALWGVIRNPERYRCAASFAGVTELDKQLAYDRDFFNTAGGRAWRDRVRGDDRGFDLDTVSPARRVNDLHRPVLLVHGRLDSTVPFRQFEIMRSAMQKARVPDAEFLVFDNAGHGFGNTADEQAWYDALLAFLARNNPAD